MADQDESIYTKIFPLNSEDEWETEIEAYQALADVPGIGQLINTGETGNQKVIYLRKYEVKTGRFSKEQIFAIFATVHAVHQLGWTFGDLHLGNIVFENNNPRIIDLASCRRNTWQWDRLRDLKQVAELCLESDEHLVVEIPLLKEIIKAYQFGDTQKCGELASLKNLALHLQN